MFDNSFSSDRFGGGISVMNPTSISNTHSPVSSNWLSTRSSKQLARQTDRKITHEHYKAMLTQTAMTNVAALSTLEAHLCEVAPYGEARYKSLADAYTMSAIITIMEWK